VALKARVTALRGHARLFALAHDGHMLHAWALARMLASNSQNDEGTASTWEDGALSTMTRLSGRREGRKLEA